MHSFALPTRPLVPSVLDSIIELDAVDVLDSVDVAVLGCDEYPELPPAPLCILSTSPADCVPCLAGGIIPGETREFLPCAPGEFWHLDAMVCLVGVAGDPERGVDPACSDVLISASTFNPGAPLGPMPGSIVVGVGVRPGLGLGLLCRARVPSPDGSIC